LRILLVALIGLASLNLWTGGPLFALWIGSRIQGSGPTSMTAVLVVAIVLGAVSLGLIRLIAVLQVAYRKQSGQTPQVRAHTPWLRSMRGERPVHPGEGARLTAPERMLVAVAIAAIIAFEVWFFFFSGSPIDQRSGRGSITFPGSGWSSPGAAL
jgi:MFS superfamily sulfate permease-like transporter